VHLARFLAGYTLFMVVAYSAIPYKTPWCALSFLHGMVLLAGVGAVALVRAMPRLALRVAVAVVLVIGGVHLAWQAHRASFRFANARFNPYVYAPTAPDLLNLVRRVEDIAAISPEGRGMLVRVIAPESWPLPWYFRRYPNVDYWPELPGTLRAPVVIAAADAPAEVKTRLASGYRAGNYGLRPGVTLALYVRKDLWGAFLERASSRRRGTVGPDE
jgi:predicted membrane-bound mannosyltransferase